MIDQMYLMFFNLFFTSLPPIAMGMFNLIEFLFFNIYFI